MYLFYAFVLALVVWTVWGFFVVHSIKGPTYTVTQNTAKYEVRVYEAYITADVRVSGTQQEALYAGFRILADYIFGNNISMTAPVSEKRVSQKLSMTVPVSLTKAPTEENTFSSERIVSFVMPESYTLQTLPKPNNSRITFTEHPKRTVAVLSFGWFASESRVTKKEAELLFELAQKGVEIDGEVSYATYNPPLTPPWLARFEVMVPMVTR